MTMAAMAHICTNMATRRITSKAYIGKCKKSGPCFVKVAIHSHSIPPLAARGEETSFGSKETGAGRLFQPLR